jgi:hypothetical protein
VDERGGLQLGIAVGEVADSAADEGKNNWRIESLQLEISGQVR